MALFSVVNFDGFCIHVDPCAPVDKSNHSQEEQLAPTYEFEFFFEDCEGGPEVDGICYPARKGWFSFSRPGQLRRCIRPYRCWYFNIVSQDDVFCSALEMLPVYASHPQMEQIVDLCRQMNQIRQRTTLAATLQIEGIISTILGLLLQHQYSTPGNNQTGVFRYQKELLAADRYIREHIDQDIDLEQLAAASHLHPTYFHKLFRAAFVHTPTQRLLRYRMWAARDMLADGNVPMTEIAERCGFSSLNYFSYKFKEYFGSSPSAYRSKLRKKN